MSTILKGYKILQEDGFRSFLYRASMYLLWREKLIQLFPGWVLYELFEVKSKIQPSVSDANPLDLIWINPSDIVYFHTGYPDGLGRVMAGSWDTPSHQFEQHYVFKSMKKRYNDEVPWCETELYETAIQNIEDEGSFRNYTAIDELDDYFQNIDQLYKIISREGYLSQRELLSKFPNQTKERNNDCVHPLLNEIGVHIYGDGEIVKKGSGNHRLSIAKILGIDRVPAIVRVRHEDWQNLRDELKSSKSVGELSKRARKNINHPDMEDISVSK